MGKQTKQTSWDAPVMSSHTFSQEEDCCGRIDHNGQSITVLVENGGGGPYLVLKTDRWAMDPADVDKFADMLKRVVGEHRDFFAAEKDKP